MSNTEYQMTQDQLLSAAALLVGLDLEEFIAVINHAEAIVLFIDPTLFMKGAKKLGQIKRIAQGAVHLQKAAQEVAEECVGVRV